MEFEKLAEFGNLILAWVGFGTVIGLTAKAVMPGRDAGGAIATILMGIAGALIGCAMLHLFYPERIVLPISAQGAILGTAGAAIVLGFHNVLGEYWFDERAQKSIRHRRRRRFRAVIDD